MAASADLLEKPDAPEEADEPRTLDPGRATADRVFHHSARAVATIVLALTASIGLFLGYQAVPTLHHYGLKFFTESQWQPHLNVVEVLEAIAPHYPLVILSNSMVDLIPASVAHLKAPFHAVYTAEEAQAYKPRMQAFEFMLDQLGCAPEHILHVSSSYRYDLMTAHDLRFGMRAFVNRGHEPLTPYYGAHEISGIGGLPALVGL